MKNRRTFLLSLTAGLVAAAVIITPVIAEELFGNVLSVDVAAKKLTITTKEGTEVVVTTTDSTEIVTGKGDTIDLEKIARGVNKAKEAGKKGAMAKVTHEKGVASKIIFGGLPRKRKRTEDGRTGAGECARARGWTADVASDTPSSMPAGESAEGR